VIKYLQISREKLSDEEKDQGKKLSDARKDGKHAFFSRIGQIIHR